MRAIICAGPGEAKLVSDRPIPTLRDDYVLVKTHSVAINPTDWKHVDFISTTGALVGCDYAGFVEEEGKAVTKDFKKGDRIAGFVHGMNAVQIEDGAFAEFIVAKGDLQFQIPNSMSFDEAATLPLGVITVGQNMYQAMGLPWPNNPSSSGEKVLIYGASSATGTLAVQFAKLSGLSPIAVCSSKHFDLVKSLGATAVYDYKTDLPSKIRVETNNSLKYAFDCISSQSTAEYCAAALTSGSDAKFSNLLGEVSPRKDVASSSGIAYTAMGEDIVYIGTPIAASAEDFEFARRWFEMTESFLAEGKLKTHPLKIGPNGLAGVLEGMDLSRKGLVSGQKLVYHVSETP
ncbi:uncharacterized protein PV07_00003 [Cladophialophora immunda]|uniref:Enoyl reductase (ER) domain-containing protein n=1 Tax=Cladophialophora immunda TaxID=569365 RepID=A0A0D2B6C8_9EURO|nr:uncharacterized protein PV07_00003 [Cladophialophora immunda]KIW33132.1 hypothetical protein PV07_00003 [Cladophialophora immunda]